ncbi:MAG: Toluene-4-monooxygenase, subunit TmoC [Marmoricola sp.]|jgi:toluene monooxygenase system ferredoxin subunit|nr:Toluene-4-monooxygenase, subunit TmoC [Marmoricola sp.]
MSTSTETGTWTQVTTLDDLWEGEMAPYTVEGTEVLLINAAGTIAAYEDKCPHVANPLSTGTLEGDQLSCAAHNWTFDVRDGAGRNPATACLKRFALRIEDDAVYVNVGDVVQEAQKGM